MPVLLSSFAAEPRDGGVLLSWHTSFEYLHDGFNVYQSRSLAAGFDLIDEHLIRSRGPYSSLDKTTSSSTTYFYKLGAVDLSGAEDLFDPISVTTPAWGIRPGISRATPNHERLRCPSRCP